MTPGSEHKPPKIAWMERMTLMLWWWRKRLARPAKLVLLGLLALVLGAGGFLGAVMLVEQTEQTTLVERTFTVLRTIQVSGEPPRVETEIHTVTTPIEVTTEVERVRTVRRNGKTVLVTLPSETITNAVTVRGKDRVVTDMRTSTVVRTRDRFNTITTPGSTVTGPGETVTTPGRTETRETTIEGPTHTITNERTVTNEQTVTGPTTTVTGPTVTVTGPEVTVTVTAPPPPPPPPSP